MPFIASNGLTEEGTSKTIAVGGMPGGMTVHYHDVGEGEPVLSWMVSRASPLRLRRRLHADCCHSRTAAKRRSAASYKG